MVICMEVHVASRLEKHPEHFKGCDGWVEAVTRSLFFLFVTKTLVDEVGQDAKVMVYGVRTAVYCVLDDAVGCEQFPLFRECVFVMN